MDETLTEIYDHITDRITTAKTQHELKHGKPPVSIVIDDHLHHYIKKYLELKCEVSCSNPADIMTKDFKNPHIIWGGIELIPSSECVLDSKLLSIFPPE